MPEHYQPIACSLPARESRDQIGEWRALSAHRVTSERIEGGYAVTFDTKVAPVVEDLARREAACCGFLTIDATHTDRGVRLIMTSENPDALPVIDLLSQRGGHGFKSRQLH
jgi:hypothetical protein